VLERLVEALGGRVRRNQPLGDLTTYRVGGPAALLVEAHGEEDLRSVHRALVVAAGRVPVLVLGKGSNLLVSDAGFPGLVLTLGKAFSGIQITGQTVRAGAAAGLPVVARRTAGAGLRGMEWAVGVPGSVGGALRMNAGGHGSDVAAVLGGFRLFDLAHGRPAEHAPGRLALGYRHSALAPGEVVVWAEFLLQPGDRTRSSADIAEIVRWRREHQPGGSNAGSVFTNPEGDSAGRLVEEAGLKGLRIGTAQVSTRHANFIQADAGGSADDVRALIDHVRSVVNERLGIELVPEVRLVGFPDQPPETIAAVPLAGEPT
jgi:UDP-N-acetylmuramate dehydrogenase